MNKPSVSHFTMMVHGPGTRQDRGEAEGCCRVQSEKPGAQQATQDAAEGFRRAAIDLEG